jgi:hypothetical protein
MNKLLLIPRSKAVKPPKFALTQLAPTINILSVCFYCDTPLRVQNLRNINNWDLAGFNF